MPKEYKEYIFQQINGIWRVVNVSDSTKTLAEFCEELNILIDENAQFVRIVRNNERIYFRAYGGKITINIHYV